MALENILKEIIKEAGSEAEKIIHSAETEAEGILKEAVSEAGDVKNKIVDSARKEEESLFRKEVISYRLARQKEVLQVKQEELRSCFQEAEVSLLSLDDNSYCALISAMLTKIEFKSEAEIIFSSSDGKRISESFIRKINPHLKLLFSESIKGGFILKSRDLIINSSIESILTALRPRLEPEAAQMLFEGSGD